MAPKRKSIPKNIKEQVWDHYVGKDKGTAMCFCCKKKEIRQSYFHAGHIISVARGGSTTVDNMKPICRSCNQSMGMMDMDIYIKTYKPDAVFEKEKTKTAHTPPEPEAEKKLTKKEKIQEYIKEVNSDIVQIYRDMFHEYCNPLNKDGCILVEIIDQFKPSDDPSNRRVPECPCGMDQFEIEKEASDNIKKKNPTREDKVRYIINQHLSHYFDDDVLV